MANKLKNMRLTSVDLVRNGANQEADICLFKSADAAEDPTQPTTEEKNIFKRFINWLRENNAEAGGEAAIPETVEKDYTTFDSLNATRESNEKLWQYTSALTESIRSIQMDQDLDKDQKYQLMAQSLDQFDEAMDKLIESLSGATPPDGLAKSEGEEEEDDEWDDEEEWDPEEGVEDVEKINHNHDALGRFASGGGGGGGLSGSDVRSFGVPGTSGSYHMGKKEKKLAQTIIDNEELDLKIQDGKDAYGNITTSFHGTREDYQTFKEMWNMVAPSELGKSADIVEIEVVEKFNPNHDAQGRFASGGGGGAGGSDDFLLDDDDGPMPWESNGRAASGDAGETKKPKTTPAKESPKNPLPNVPIDTSSYSWFKHGKEPGGVGYYSYEVTHGKNKLSTYNFHGDYHDGLKNVAEKFKNVSHISVGV